jgi:putative phage tail component, N-terminal domain
MFDTIINDVSLNAMGVLTVERPNIPTPEQRIKTIDIEGRDGSLTQLLGYSDITFTIDFNILEKTNIKPLIRQLRVILLNAKVMRFNDEPQMFYKVKSVKVGDIDNQVSVYGKFDVTFTCDPFLYEDSFINHVVSNSSAMTYLGSYFGQPSIRVGGNGVGKFSINGKVVELTNLNDYVILDTSIANAYKGSVNMNQFMRGEFPTLIPGRNTITFEGGITSLEIMPNTRHL